VYPRLRDFHRRPPGHLKSPATITVTTEPPHPHFYTPPTFEIEKRLHLRIMKFTLITAVSVLSTLASGFALPGLFPRTTAIRPSIAIVVRGDSANTPFPPTNIAEVALAQPGGMAETLLGFVVPPCTGRCTFSFSDAIAASGSRALNLLPINRYPAFGDTWNNKPDGSPLIGTFSVSATGAGPATILDDSGLTFDCPVTTAKCGFDVVPIWDDYVIWDITKGGLIITCD